ncbi:Dabb family protein, partial [uncultured Clostridium sp.]|uniref:Dabb family protein n=1 Tax=uncultured Clostridium sp. TaxID=59620 RepID=UPI00262219C0
MIKHIVMWTVKEENRIENMQKMKRDLEALKSEIKEIVEIEVGIDINRSQAAYDLVLYSTFKSLEDLNAYQVHPKHQAVAKNA